MCVCAGLQCGSLATAPHTHPPPSFSSPLLLRQMLICWCGCSPSPPVQEGGGDSPLQRFPFVRGKSNCLFPCSAMGAAGQYTLLLQLKLFSLRAICAVHRRAQSLLPCQHLSPEQRCPLLMCLCYCLCYLCLPMCMCVYVCVRENVSISIQISCHMESCASNNGSCGEWYMCSSCDNEWVSDFIVVVVVLRIGLYSLV